MPLLTLATMNSPESATTCAAPASAHRTKSRRWSPYPRRVTASRAPQDGISWHEMPARHANKTLSAVPGRACGAWGLRSTSSSLRFGLDPLSSAVPCSKRQRPSASGKGWLVTNSHHEPYTPPAGCTRVEREREGAHLPRDTPISDAKRL